MAMLTRENNKQVYYEDYGSGSEAIILVHGWGMSCRLWDYSLQSLCNSGFRVVLIDHRGCGQSSKDFADQGINAIAGDVVALIESLGIKRAILNGWSLGGAVVVEAANSLGDKCAGVVLTCGASPAYLQKPDFPYGGTEEALAETLAAMSADRINFLAALAQGVCATDITPEQIHWMWRIFTEASPMAAQALGELGPLDQREIMAQLSMPLLSFVGAHDVVVDPQICRNVKTINPAAQIIEMADSGHAPFMDETQKYNNELIKFCRSCVA
jgi:pimeloyl-[acyl-carrier protein] methyl ester esterase